MTILGLDNTGAATKDVDIERDSLDEQGKQQFNTSKSLLWILVEAAYAKEIKTLYHELRDNKYYSIQNMWDCLYTDFIARIPKSAYNSDARFRYIDIAESSRRQYMFVCNGSQEKRIKDWLTRRFIFMDSLYGYTKEFFPTTAGMRANKAGEAILRIKTFTPQYVTISFQDGQTVTKKCYPTEFTEFKGNITTAADQEVFISNAPYLKEIDNIRSLNISRLYLENAVRITKLDCSSSSSLRDLNLGNNALLRELNCSACTLLGTGESGGSLNLSKCINLISLNCSQTKISSVQLYNDGGFLKDFIANNCVNLTALHFTNQNTLTTISAIDSLNISSVTLTNCDSIKSFTLPDTDLETIVITDCNNIDSLNIPGSSMLRTLRIEHCNKLQTVSASNLLLGNEYRIKELDLSTIPSISSILLYNTPYLVTLRLPILNNIKRLIADNTGLKFIQYGEIDTSSTTFDMSKLKNLGEVSLKYNYDLLEVKDFTYKKDNASELFRGCSNLTSVTGNFVLSGSINNIFYDCQSLTVIPKMELNKVTSANYSFYSCQSIPPEIITQFIESFGNGSLLRQMDSAFYSTIGVPSGNYTLPSNLFSSTRFPKLLSLKGCFCYSNKITGTIPGDLFGLESEQSEIINISEMFEANSRITGIGTNLLKPLKKLTDCSWLFLWCNALSGAALPADFFMNQKLLTNIEGMFYESTLTGQVKKQWFSSLPALINARVCFYNSTVGGNTALEDELFKENDVLEDISGIFAKCPNILGALPENLLGANREMPMALKYAKSAFYGCYNIVGSVPINFFKQCINLKDIGRHSWVISGISKTLDGGIFGSSGLNSPFKTNTFGESIYHYLDSLVNADYAFSDTAISGEIPENLFSSCLQLTSLNGHFKGCTELTGAIKANLISGNRELLTIDRLFEGCSGLLLPDGIPNSFLWELSKLTSAKAMCKGMIGMTGSIPLQLFRDTISLKTIDSFFEDCSKLSGIIPGPVYSQVGEELMMSQKGLFDNCIQLSSINNVFKNCKKLQGSIPEHLLRSLTNLTTASGLFYNCNHLTGGYPARLLEKQTKLIDISEMFYHCNRLAGHIANNFLENCVSLQKINYTWAFNPGLVKDPDLDNIFCLPNTLFHKCSLIEAVGTFVSCSALTGNLPPELYKNQYSLQTLQENLALTNVAGTVYTTFLENCNALTTVRCLFDSTKISAIEHSPTESKYLFPKTMKALADFRSYCKDCTKLLGAVPLFEHHTKATKTACYTGAKYVDNYASFASDWKSETEPCNHADPFWNTALYPDEYDE